MNTTLLADLTADLADIGDFEDDALHSSSATLTFKRDEPVVYPVLLGGTEIEANTTLRSAALRRLTIAENQYRDSDQMYWQVSGDLTGVGFDTMLKIGDENISLVELLRRIYVTVAKIDSNGMTLADFSARVRNLGFRYNQDGTLLWQHFGAEKSAYDEAVAFMLANGAFDDTGNHDPARLNRIKKIVKFDETNPGLQVVSMEVTASDRGQSRTQQGFENLVEASVESFKRSLKLRAQRRLALSKMEAAQADGKAAEADQFRSIANHMQRNSTSWSSNLAGVQQRRQITPEGEIVAIGEDESSPVNVHIDATKANIGRLVVANGDDEVYEMDFWRRNNVAPAPVVNIDPETFKSVMGSDAGAVSIDEIAESVLGGESGLEEEAPY
jgi:hypothetical protein